MRDKLVEMHAGAAYVNHGLERVIRMETSPTRHACAWREMGRTLHWLVVPVREVERAYRRATALLPDEPRFARELRRVRTG